MKRTVKANWQGTLKEGKGSLTTPSGVLDNTPFSFNTRFEEGVKGTNPEELLAVAHAACFTMEVGARLTTKGLNPESLNTESTITLENLNITGINVTINGEVDGISSDDFIAMAKDAAKTCIIGRALSVPITCEATLVSQKAYV